MLWQNLCKVPKSTVAGGQTRAGWRVRQNAEKCGADFFCVSWLDSFGGRVPIRTDRGKGEIVMVEEEKSEQKGDLYFEGGTIIACTKYAAAYFGVTPATLSNWMKNGCPRVKHGYWDIKAVSDWNAQKEGERLAEVVKTDPAKMTPSQLKTHFEAQLKQEQLESTRLKNQIASGEYLSKTDIVNDLTNFFAIFKASAIGLGHELGQMVAAYVDTDGARRADRLISERVDDALAQMSIDGVYQPEKDDL